MQGEAQEDIFKTSLYVNWIEAANDNCTVPDEPSDYFPSFHSFNMDRTGAIFPVTAPRGLPGYTVCMYTGTRLGNNDCRFVWLGI